MDSPIHLPTHYSTSDSECLVPHTISAGAVVVFDVKVPKTTKTLVVLQKVRASSSALNVVEEPRDLGELDLALEAEEGEFVSSAISVESVLGGLEG